MGKNKKQRSQKNKDKKEVRKINNELHNLNNYHYNDNRLPCFEYNKDIKSYVMVNNNDTNWSDMLP